MRRSFSFLYVVAFLLSVKAYGEETYTIEAPNEEKVVIKDKELIKSLQPIFKLNAGVVSLIIQCGARKAKESPKTREKLPSDIYRKLISYQCACEAFGQSKEYQSEKLKLVKKYPHLKNKTINYEKLIDKGGGWQDISGAAISFFTDDDTCKRASDYESSIPKLLKEGSAP